MKINQSKVIGSVKNTGLVLGGALLGHAIVSQVQSVDAIPEKVREFAPEAVTLAGVAAAALINKPMIQSIALGVSVYGGVRTVSKHVPEALKAGMIGKFVPSLSGFEDDETLMLLQGTNDLYTEEYLEDADFDFEDELDTFDGIEGVEGLEGADVLTLMQ